MLNKDYKYAIVYLTGTDQKGNKWENIEGKMSDIGYSDGIPKSIKLWFNQGQSAWFSLKDIISIHFLEKSFNVTFFIGEEKATFVVKAFSDIHASAKVKRLIKESNDIGWVDLTSEIN